MIKRTTYAENIRKLRKRMNITQEEISAKLDIKRTTYARYETDTVPPASIIVKLSEIFNVSIDEICKGSDNYIDAINSQQIHKLRFRSPIGYNTSNNEETNPDELTEEEEFFVLKLRELTPEERNAILEQLK